MINPSGIGPKRGLGASLPGSSPSMAEAEGRRDEFREAMQNNQDVGADEENRPQTCPKKENNLRESSLRSGDADRGAALKDADGESRQRSGHAGADEEARLKRGHKDEGNAPPPPPSFSGDALLHSLGKAYSTLETQTSSSAGVQNLSTLASDLAERILVNTDKQTEGGEVRITLKDSLLPDTEIILSQDEDRMSVRLASGNPASLETLRLAQADLQGKLLALGLDVSVEVQDNRERDFSGNGSGSQGREGDGSGHHNARSRGLDYFKESGS